MGAAEDSKGAGVVEAIKLSGETQVSAQRSNPGVASFLGSTGVFVIRLQP